MTEESAEAAPAQPSTEVAVVEEQDLARQRSNEIIDRAALGALESSPLHHDEFMTLAVTAKMLSMSGAAPKYVRDNPHVAFHVALIGRDLGISPTLALNLIDIIPGKDKELEISLSPQLRAAQVKRLGLGVLKPIYQKPERAVWVALTNGGTVDPRCMSKLPDKHFERVDESGATIESCRCYGIEGVTEFTWQMAIVANLVDDRCTPGNHWKVGSTYCRCKHNWKTYDFRMCSWRAGGYCADDFFPEAAVGLYSPEELGAVVDVEGRAIDPSTIDVPEGYESTSSKSKQNTPPGDAAALWDLQERIYSLPDEERADLNARWKQHEKLSGRPVRTLDESQQRLASSIVGGFENKAKARKIDIGERREQLRARVAAKLVELLVIGGRSDAQGASDSSVSDDQTSDLAKERESTGEAASDDSEGTAEVESAAVDVEKRTDPPITNAAVVEALGEQIVDEEIEHVKSMSAGEVRQSLTALGLDTEGAIAQLRHRLTVALLRKRYDVREQS